jgi:hypothetical protein
MASNFGILGPVIHPEHYKQDRRIASSEVEFYCFACELEIERGETIYPAITDEQLETKH